MRLFISIFTVLISFAAMGQSKAAATPPTSPARSWSTTLLPQFRELRPSSEAGKAAEADSSAAATAAQERGAETPPAAKLLDARTCQNAKGVIFRSEDPGYADCYSAYLKVQEESLEGSDTEPSKPKQK